MEIEIAVYLANEKENDCILIKITKEELMQLACNKAKEMYKKNHWFTISSSKFVTIKLD